MISKNILRIFFILIYLILILSFSKPILAFDNFIEEFNSNFSNPDIWDITNNDGVISFTENPNFITLRSPGFSFPYIRTNDLIILDQDFEIEIAFQYLPSLFDFGSGIAASYTTLDNNEQIISEKIIFGIWQDNGPNKYLRISTNVCPSSEPNCTEPVSFYRTDIEDTNYHVVKYRYKNNIYEVFLDDVLKFTSSQTYLKPNTIWFGNKVTVNQSNKWTNFKINYIYINPIPQEPPSEGGPIIFLPGMMGCWNNVIVTGGESNNWYLWSIAYNFVYKNLLNNFELAGLVKNQDYYVFCYDWRKPIEENKEALSYYILGNIPPNENVNLVGHSMGGLIARSYTQSNPSKVNKLITVGSPHKGAPKSYFAWEGGIIIEDNIINKLLIELLIRTNNLLEYNAYRFRTIRSKIPSLKDLLPTYDFLVDKNDHNNIKPIADHKQKNDYFMDLNNVLHGQVEVRNKMSTIYGTGFDTLYRIIVETLHPHANWIHYASGLWEDGLPISNKSGVKPDYSPSFINSDGDNRVTLMSATFNGVESYNISGDHAEIIKNSQGIMKIFEILDLDFPNDISLITEIKEIFGLVLHSPATFSLTDNFGQPVGFQDDNVIVAVNPPDNLNLNVVGNDDIDPNTSYQISFIELDDQNNITNYQFFSQIDPNQENDFHLNDLKDHIFVNQDNQEELFNSLINKINHINELLDEWNELKPHRKKSIKRITNRALIKANQYKKSYDKQRFRQAFSNILICQKYLFSTRKLINKYGKDSLKGLEINEQIYSAFSEIKYLYTDAYSLKGFNKSLKYLERYLSIIKNALNKKNKKMQQLHNSGKNIYQYQVKAFQNAENNLNKAKGALSQDNKIKALYYLTVCRWFLNEI